MLGTRLHLGLFFQSLSKELCPTLPKGTKHKLLVESGVGGLKKMEVCLNCLFIRDVSQLENHLERLQEKYREGGRRRKTTGFEGL